jgi:hypothetical protein
LTLERHCGLDLDQGRTICSDIGKRYSEADLWLVSDRDAALYLQPAGKAGFVVNPPPTTSCALPLYGYERYNVTGLGPGMEFCVHTGKGRNAYVYLPERVKAGSPSIKLYYVLYSYQPR